MTGIHPADVLYAFNTLQLVKYWKGSSLARLENGLYPHSLKVHGLD